MVLRLRVVIGRLSAERTRRSAGARGAAVPDRLAGEWDVALLGGLTAAEISALAAELGAERRILSGPGGLAGLGHALADLVPGTRRGRDEPTSGILARSDRIIEDHAQRLASGGWVQVARLACGLAVGHAHLSEAAAGTAVEELTLDYGHGDALVLAADCDHYTEPERRRAEFTVAAERGDLRLLHTPDLSVSAVDSSDGDDGTWLHGCVEPADAPAD
jgi:hypothetical protein